MKIRKGFFVRPGVVVALLANGIVGPASAQYRFVDQRSDLLANDWIDWGVLGTTGTMVGHGATAQSVGGVDFELGFDGHRHGKRRDQGDGWLGNFRTGERVLWTESHGPLTVWFDGHGRRPIFGAGAQFQANFYGPFTGLFEMLDYQGNVLFGKTFTGLSTAAGDGSAVFVGGTSTLGNIYGVRFTGVNSTSLPQDFAVNQLSLRTFNGIPVPEPAEWAAFGMLTSGVVTLMLRSRRHR